MSTSRVGLTNRYIYGGAILSLLMFVFGLLTAGSVSQALTPVVDFYLMKLIPWPINELLMAETILELIVSHAVTIGVGLLFATAKWWDSMGR